MLDYVYEPEEEVKPTKKQGGGGKVINLPKSNFAMEMAATMNSYETGPRRLKGDEYKEFMVETEEEMKGPQPKKPKKANGGKKKQPAMSWRNIP